MTRQRLALIVLLAGALLWASQTPTADTFLIARGSVWRYLDTGAAPSSSWRTVSFNDSAWTVGAAELGYGDGDETTVVSYGPNSSAKYITTYFRQAFTVATPGDVQSLSLRLKRDDGAVAYLNGTEVFRTNMPGGTISHTTVASSAIDDEPRVVRDQPFRGLADAHVAAGRSGRDDGAMDRGVLPSPAVHQGIP